ncbi:type II toxin-antitoxin system MqsR family toxin [Pseudomonas sp. C1C7]|uniref:type II toxin-antitoxin system MqsR family toxin n=1 Tax=Pseudomonas sp. C1C7 TaxID=2735272 RepID=UPI0015865AC7|nr:type II toxin-antitoxin system MqsR family toxin [Pseudomonas sp. C1C7]NUT76547.1 type II toxin-antitoxin system MqsR family toxin [Pseudomonas sp. C1C7]
MEKKTPHYNLALIKADVRRLGAKAFTRTARENARDLGFSITEMQEAVFELERDMLYKSMTTYDDHRVWQDVYHTHSCGLEIYIKVTCCTNGEPPVISFKERKS